MSVAPISSKRRWLTAGGVFAIALLVRLLFLFSSPDRAWPHSIYFEGDAPEWVNYASALERGQQYEFGLPLRSPAVAYVLHVLAPRLAEHLKADGHYSFAWVKTLWCVCSALSCALAYLAFASGFPQRIALIAAVLCVFSFGSYIAATSLNNETLYTLALMAIVLSTVSLARRPCIFTASGLAVMHGLATLIRPEHTLLLLLLSCYIAIRWIYAAKAEKKPTFLRAAALLATILIGSVIICLPWSIRGSLSAQRMNQFALVAPDYDHAALSWTAEARALVDSFPAFARNDNFVYITAVCRAKGERQMTADRVRQILMDEFSALPEPLSRWVFVSSQGPLSFALANHPTAGGGFSKSALVNPHFGNDPKLNLTMPSHLRLYNHGYAVGMGYITSDINGWLRNVGLKLAHFGDGITLGFMAWNLPIGRAAVRRPVDLATPEATAAPIWRIAMFGLIAFGMMLAALRRTAGIWFLIILYKLIVTILFYGYARQAVTILPAFFLFVALALDQIGQWLSTLLKPSRRTKLLAVITVVGGLVCIEIAAAAFRQPLAIDGAIRAAPQWGRDAFESYETIRIKPVAK